MKEIKIFVDESNSYQDENLKIEIVNLTEFLSAMEKFSETVPSPSVILTIVFKITVDEKEFQGETIFDSNKSLETVVDENCPYQLKITDWRLGEGERYIKFEE